MTARPFIRVTSQGRPLFLFPEVAEALRVSDGQAIDSTTRWRAIDLNLAVIRAEEDMRIGGNATVRAAMARAIDATERIVAAHYAAVEGRRP